MTHKFGKIFLAIALAACSMQVAKAIPAYPHPIKVKQADGSMLTILMRGDEHGHYTMTSDGKPLIFNAASGNYEYAKLQNGKLADSGIKATEVSKRTAEAKAFLQTQDAESILKVCRQKREAQLAKVSSMRRIGGQQKASADVQSHKLTSYPVKGKVHSLVILVQFSDTPFTTTGTDASQFYNDMFNKQGFTYNSGANGSVRDFYVDNSSGAFQPTFDIIGPVTLPEKCFYYGANLGSNDNPERMEEFLREACTLADPMVNFADYDNDGDGYVDNIYFYYAGYGAADSGESRTIWPHASTYQIMAEDAGLSNTTLKLDGVNIGSYSCSNEINGRLTTPQPTGIGTFVHEFGHVLGLADHYDIYYGTATFAPGKFDTMAMGSYNNNGNTPPAFSAYERACLGWTDLVELNATTDTLNVLPDLKDSNKAYRVSVSGTKGNEFYVLENRQQKGWDEYIPGHGMLMWHIDYDKDVWLNNEVNITGSHQRVDIVEADDRRTDATTSGDPFPGTSNVTKWQMTSWADENVMALDDIEEKDGMINVMLGGLNLKLATPQINFQSVADSSAVISWDAVPVAKEYVLNIKEVKDGGKQSIAAYTDKTYTEPTTLSIIGLTPETEYEFSLKVQRGSYTSDEFSQTVKTTAVPFSKKYVTDMKADRVGETSFSASWSGIADADDYEVTLSKLVYDTETHQQGYDFTDGLSGMPSTWTTDGTVFNSFYGEAAPSIRLNAKDSYVSIAYANQHISAISFYARTSNATHASLTVEALYDGKWTEVAKLTGGAGMSAGDTYSYSFDEADAVRLRVDGRQAGAFFIDDIYAACHALLALPMDGYDGVSTNGKTSCEFSGLESSVNYALTIIGKKGSEYSYPSAQLFVSTPATAGITIPKMSEQDDDNNVEYFDLNGRKLSAAKLTHGVYVVKKGNTTYKIVK